MMSGIPINRRQFASLLAGIFISGPLAMRLTLCPEPTLSAVGFVVHQLSIPFGMLMLAALVGAPACLLVALVDSSSRRGTLILAGQCIVIVTAIATALSMTFALRDAALARVADRSEPLIVAVDRYVAAKGKPPASLEELVPDFLPVLPTTGIGAAPDYRFRVRDEQRRPTPRWCLFASVPSAGLDFPRFEYDSTGQYSEPHSRIGRWAYIPD